MQKGKKPGPGPSRSLYRQNEWIKTRTDKTVNKKLAICQGRLHPTSTIWPEFPDGERRGPSSRRYRSGKSVSQIKRPPECAPTRFSIRKKTAHYFYHESRICQGKSPHASILGNDDGEVRAEEGAHAALLALSPCRRFPGGNIRGSSSFSTSSGPWRTKFDADAAPLAILSSICELDHTGSRLPK